MLTRDSKPATRSRATGAFYGVALVGMAAALWRVGGQSAMQRPLVCVAAAALAAVVYLAVEEPLRDRGVTFDGFIALSIVALAAGGPVAAFAMPAVQDVIRLARRRRRFLGLGLLANLVSYLGLALAGAAVLAAGPRHGMGLLVGVVLAGAAMTAANYVFARLLFAWMRDGRSPLELLRLEFIPMLPVELALVLLAMLSVALLAPHGVAALLPLAAVVYTPQWAFGILTRGESVARLDVRRAAHVYLRALVDELGLPPGVRRAVLDANALLAGAPAHPRERDFLRTLTCALEADICLRHPPVQATYKAPLTVQALLVAEAWAQLTAQGTRALSHEEALSEMWLSDLSADAPDALTAAGAIAERQRALTKHSSSLPHLHRLPLPRSVRVGVLPAVLGRLTA